MLDLIEDFWLGAEFDNEISERTFQLGKSTPAKDWWDADFEHPAIARALRVGRLQFGAVYALAPFRLFHDGTRHLILAAYPTPRILGPIDPDWTGIEQVIAWCPKSNTAEILGDPVPQTVGSWRDERAILYGDPRTFFTDWMRDRAAFFALWCQSQSGEWVHSAPERDFVPGCLAVGPIDAIRWQPSQLPENLTCIGLDAKKLNSALIRAAKIPRAHNQSMRAAA